MSEVENTENKPTEEINQTTELEAKKQVYELGYLLVPTIPEENAPAIFGDLQEKIINEGGEIISSEMPKMLHLAYVMTKNIENTKQKFDTAYFGWIKFEIETSKISLLKKEFDLNQNLIRFLIIKTVRENTLAPKRYVGSRFRNGAERKEDTENEEKETGPMDKEEVDKEIDALVEEAV